MSPRPLLAGSITWRAPFVLGVATLLFAAGCGGSRQASSTHPTSSTQLVVAIEQPWGNEDAGYRLYAVGDGHARLLSSHGRATGASLAPDGLHVGYLAGTGSPWTLFVENVDGSSRQTIATCSEAACGPRVFSYAWSPTGDRLLYTTVEKGRPHIRIASLTGDVLAELAPGRPKPTRDAEPVYFADASWSPRGRWITVVEALWDKWGGSAFARAVDLTRADASDWRRVLGTSYGRPQFGWPEVAWAPDERFAVEGAADEIGPVPLYAVFTPDGRRLDAADCGRSDRGRDIRPPFCPKGLAWSPNARWIAWVRWGSGRELIVASPDLRQMRRIKLPGTGDWQFARPEWSADGRRIALAQDPASGYYRDVVVVPARGGSPTRVFSAPQGDWEVVSHAWQTVTG